MSMLLASPASAAVSTNSTLTASPSSLQWSQGISIKYNVSVNGGYIWWNGTATLYLINPEGTNRSYGTSAINLGSSITADWANWSVSPSSMSGTWTVWVTHSKTSGNGTYLLVTNETTTFSMESSGEWINRTVQDWTAIWWMLFIIAILLVMLVAVFGRVNKDSGGKKL